MHAGAPKDFSPLPAGRRHARTPPDPAVASVFCVCHVRGCAERFLPAACRSPACAHAAGHQRRKRLLRLPCARVCADKIEAAATAGTAVGRRHVCGCVERFLPAACRSPACARVRRRIFPHHLPCRSPACAHAAGHQRRKRLLRLCMHSNCMNRSQAPPYARQLRKPRSSAAIRAAPKAPRRIRARRIGAQACRRARHVL